MGIGLMTMGKMGMGWGCRFRWDGITAIGIRKIIVLGIGIGMGG